MKRPSSGNGALPWVVYGLVGLYILGGVAVYADARIVKTNWIFGKAPDALTGTVIFLYYPFLELLEKFGIFL